MATAALMNKGWELERAGRSTWSSSSRHSASLICLLASVGSTRSTHASTHIRIFLKRKELYYAWKTALRDILYSPFLF